MTTTRRMHSIRYTLAIVGLMLCICLTCFNGTVLASEKQDMIEETNYNHYYYNQMTDVQKSIFDVLVSNDIMNPKSEIDLDIGEQSFNYDDYYVASEVAKVEDPWFTVFSTDYERDGSVIKLKFQRNFSTHDIQKAQSRLNQIVRTMGDGNRFSQVVNLLKFFSKHIEYDSEGVMWDSLDSANHSIVSPAVYNIGVCDGFSYLIKAACDLMDIPCLVVEGLITENSGHAWNYIRMEDGLWYLIDGTNFSMNNDAEQILFRLNDNVLIGSNKASQDYRYAQTRGAAIWASQSFTVPSLPEEDYSIENREHPYNEAEYEFVYDGESSFSYTLNEDDTCTVTGFEGKEDSSLIIPAEIDGHIVSSIGRRAFYHCDGFTGDLILPDTVESIGDEAFYYCSGLRGHLKLSSSLKSIGTKAFMNCFNLSGELVLPDSLYYIGDYTFLHDDAFEGTLVIPAGISSLNWLERALKGVDVFSVDDSNEYLASKNGIIYSKDFKRVLKGSYSLKGNIEIETGAETIARWAFDGCNQMTGVDIPEGVTFIERVAFNGCQQLKKVHLPSTLTRTEWAVFLGCGQLEEINIPGSLQNIEDGMFHDCTSLKEIVIPEGVKEIGETAFYNCCSLSKISLPKSLEHISFDAFSQCYDLEEIDYKGTVSDWNQINIEGNNEQLVNAYQNQIIRASGYTGNLAWTLKNTTLMITGSGNMRTYESYADVPWNQYRDEITSVVIKSGAVKISPYAFYDMENLTSVTLPDTVTIIGNYAFRGCTSLEEIDLPQSLTKLGEGAFYGCSSLNSIEVPEGIYTVWEYCFKNCTSLEHVSLPQSLIKLGEAAFYGCSSLMSIEIPDNCSIIDVYCFKNCSRLADVKLPATLGQLREAVFYATNLYSLDVPSNVTSVGPYAFKKCISLTNINLPASLTRIDEAAFYECNHLTSIEIPDGVTTIGNYAFRRCTGLGTVIFPTGLKTVGECSFYGCTGLMSISLPKGLTEIKDYAFKACSKLVYLTLPGTVETLGESAFNTCEALESIVIPASVKTIKDYCFSGNVKLKIITFQGSAPAIGLGAFKNVTSRVYYPAEDASWTSAVKANYGGNLNWTEK